MKTEKLRRYWKARLAPKSALPMFWHIGKPNFGDDINPSFFSRITGKKVRYEKNRNEEHYLGAGSILDKMTPSSIILGSGFLIKPSSLSSLPKKIISLRGELSKQPFGDIGNIWLGDPLILINLLVETPLEKNYRYGLVPHVTNVKQMRETTPKSIHIIDPSTEPWHLISEIAKCEYIFSQSLHGLIVADALKIPNIWIEPDQNMVGGKFKFYDYFSTLDQGKVPFRRNLDLFLSPPASRFTISNYLYNKNDYLNALVSAVNKSS